MPITLHDHAGHRCLMFTDLIEDGGNAVQSNQFLIVDGNFQFFDPASGILFSGGLGVSLVGGKRAGVALSTISPLPPGVNDFHQRCMVSASSCACRSTGWSRCRPR